MTALPLVIVTSSSDYPVDVATVAETLRGKAQYRVIDLPHRTLSAAEEDDLIARFKGASAVFVRPGIITRRIIEACPDLRIIAVHGAGVDQVDVAAATDAGVVVTNVPGGNANAVAELAFGLMLSLMRRIPQGSWIVQHEGKWDEGRLLGDELRGKTLGVVGCGHVGRRVIGFAQAFEMSVLAYDPLISAEAIQAMGAKPVDLATLLQSVDVLTLHVPLMDKTRHLIGASQLASMKKGALLINTSRGPIVDEAALCAALQSGHLGGAALDVMEKEPPAVDIPLRGLPNVIITPHIAGSTHQVLTLLAKTCCEEIVRVLQGERPLHPVNPAVLSA
jgi:D-3-phosphoglycerate dehydrogenase